MKFVVNSKPKLEQLRCDELKPGDFFRFSVSSTGPLLKTVEGYLYLNDNSHYTFLMNPTRMDAKVVKLKQVGELILEEE